jgi:DnaK suppressor protein
MNSDTAVRLRRAHSELPPPDVEAYRALLIQQQAELRRSCGQLADGDDHSGENSRQSDDTADQASRLSEETLTIQMLERAQIELEKITESLERMDEGAYGICKECSEPIPQARLEALPTATTCIQCQSRLESN